LASARSSSFSRCSWHSFCASRRVWTSNVSVGVSPISIVKFGQDVRGHFPLRLIRLARYSGSVAYSSAFSLPGKCLTGRPFRLIVHQVRGGHAARALSAPPHRLRWGRRRSLHFFGFSPQSSARFVPSKDQFLSERKKRGRSRDTALAATSISSSGILYDLRSRRAHRIAWR
jgi:hypothetical protein